MEPELEPLEESLVKLKQRDSVLCEMIAMLSINGNHRWFAPPLREWIDIFRAKLDMGPVEWEPWEEVPRD